MNTPESTSLHCAITSQHSDYILYRDPQPIMLCLSFTKDILQVYATRTASFNKLITIVNTTTYHLRATPAP